jgi:beta-glucosidase
MMRPMVEHEAVEAFDADALNRGNRGVRLADTALDARVDALVARLSLDDKVALMHGSSLATDELFETPADPVSGLPPLRMVDGPRGVRAGIATTFPVAMARGATWDVALEARVGEAIALEARARGANVLLAPAINLLRHPGWGRAQETYGEDSLHVGRMGFAFVAGAQRHLIASVKHFALNSIENSRFEVDVQADARTLREVYLPHFELCVRGAHAGSVMSAYNRVNGSYCAENRALLRDILKGEWGFRGFVESDWVWGTRSTVASAHAGLDIEMPLPTYYGKRLAEAVARGRVPITVVDEAVRRILRVKLAFGLDAPDEVSTEVIECAAHTELALEVARKSMVLLKNEGGLLPLRRRELGKLAVVGTLAAMPNTGDRGSSAVRSTYVVTPLEGLTDALGAKVEHIDADQLDAAAERTVSAADAAVVVVGLTFREEGELIPFMEGGGDRSWLRLSPVHEALIRRVAALQPRTVVVLVAGSALELPWLDAVPAVLLSFYPGMLGGEALAELLLGARSPSGKLPFTMAAAADLPSFAPDSPRVFYEREHGYRWLLARARTPRFAFGFGLAYADVAYRTLQLSQRGEGDTLEVCATVEVENLSARTHEEVVQLYAHKPGSRVARSGRWLVGFGRLRLAAGQRKQLRMRVTARELGYWDEAQGAFALEPGAYVLSAGGSSLALPLSAPFHLPG